MKSEVEDEAYRVWEKQREELELPAIGDIIESPDGRPSAVGWLEKEAKTEGPTKVQMSYSVSCIKSNTFPEPPIWVLNPDANRGLRILLYNQPKEDIYKIRVTGVSKSRTCLFGKVITEKTISKETN